MLICMLMSFYIVIGAESAMSNFPLFTNVTIEQKDKSVPIWGDNTSLVLELGYIAMFLSLCCISVENSLIPSLKVIIFITINLNTITVMDHV